MSMADAYASHKFRHIPGNSAFGNDPSDAVLVCDDCGCEDMGDPAEFPELQYPMCDREDV